MYIHLKIFFPSSLPLHFRATVGVWFLLSQNVFFTIFIFEYCFVECFSKLLAAYIPLAFQKNVCFKKGVDIGNSLPSLSKRGENARISHPFCVCVYTQSHTQIYFIAEIQTWRLSKFGMSFRCRVCGFEVNAFSQSSLKPLKNHGQRTCVIHKKL